MGSSGGKDDINSTDNGDRKADNPSDSATLFIEGEKVLAYHGPCIYEAKVQKVESWKKEQRYFVHYLGWNKNWDEWVGSDRLLKSTDENRRKQQALTKKQSVDKNPKLGRSQIKPKSSTEAKADKEDLRNYVGKGKKRKVESGIEEDTVSVDKHLKIQFPSTLKKQLVDDCEFVTQLGKLVKLPRSPTVDDIMCKYLEYRGRKSGTLYLTPEILKGIRNYFDKALPKMLLYQQERQQYHDAIKDRVSPSTVYGAEHLLRLFVKIPDLLSCVNLEEDALGKVGEELHDFLKYIQKNQSNFFLSTYESITVDNKEEGN